MRLSPGPLLVSAAVVVAFAWYVWAVVLSAPPGVQAAREGDRLLADRAPAAAFERFEAALDQDPDLLPARLGRAAALLAMDETAAAENALDALVLSLRPTAADADRRAYLAAALANRGVLKDRTGRHAEALTDYKAAIRADAAIAAGPGVLDRLLSGVPDASSIAERAAYLESQLALSPENRLLAVPDLDDRQPLQRP